MTRAFLSILLILLIWINAPHVQAQDVQIGSGDEPLEIVADESLEWKRAEQLFIARRNAVATQGDASVAGQVLTAYYREGNGKDMEIYKVTADTDVKITSRDSIAYGDHADYNLDEGLAVLTGQDLKLVTPEQTITAQDRFEYQVTAGRVIAVGRPRVIRPKPQGGGTDTLDSDELIATLKDNSEGKRVVDVIEAKGNVVITTPTEVVKGAYGIYRAGTNKAELSGGVTITRGPNVLEGEKAIVDLTTNTSQVFGSPIEGGRVRGVFYPGSEKKQDQTGSAPQQVPEETELPPAPAIEAAPHSDALDTAEPATPALIEPEAGEESPQTNWAPLTRP